MSDPLIKKRFFPMAIFGVAVLGWLIFLGYVAYCIHFAGAP